MYIKSFTITTCLYKSDTIVSNFYFLNLITYAMIDI